MRNPCHCCKNKMKKFITQMDANFKHSMVIPERFLSHFVGKTMGTINLDAPNGSIYQVGVVKKMNRTFLQSGWDAFADANHIQENDLLSFRHCGSSCFRVTVFDSSGWEKGSCCAGTKPLSSVQHVDISSSSGCNITQSSASEGSDECQEASGKPMKTPAISSPSKEISAEENTFESESLESDDPTQSSGGKRFAQMGSSSHHRKTAKTAAASFSAKESGEDSPENNSFKLNDLQAHPKPDYVLSFRNYLSEAQKEKVVALIQEIQHETTVFVAIMGKSNVRSKTPFLYISSHYAAVHFPCETATVTLQRPGKSKKWHPRSYTRKDRRQCMLAGQWLGFVHDNNVKEDDICVFVPMKARRKYTFTVHLIRAAATHSKGTGVEENGSTHGRTNTKKASAVNIKEEPTDGEDISTESWHGVPQESLRSEDSGPSVPPYIVPAKNRLSQLQKNIVEEKVQAIQSEVPIFVKIMSRTNVGATGHGDFMLELGSRYAAAHLPHRNEIVVLQCMGKIWKVNMVVSGNHKRWFLISGWRKFVLENRLRVGDICLFELKKEEKLTMAVHIISSQQH